MIRRPRAVLLCTFLAGAAFAVGVAVGVSWPDDDEAAPAGRSLGSLPANERCVRWLVDVENGTRKLTAEQRRQVVRAMHPRASDLARKPFRFLMSRREPCARAARFGLVGSDGSLGPLALDILMKCELFHYLEAESDEDSRNVVRDCRRIDAAIGRDPNQFG